MSMTRDDKIKCDECGRFIGVQDLIGGKAMHHCVLPDSEFSDETFESLCARCWTPPGCLPGAKVMSLGKAFQQIADDEGKCDLSALWQAVIDNTKGNGFWLGEILLDTIERETGFNGSAVPRPHRESGS